MPEFSNAAALLKHAGRYARGENLLSTLLGLVQVAMTISLAWLVATFLDGAVYQQVQTLPDTADWLTLAAVFLIRAAAAYGQSRIGNRASIKIRNALRGFALQRCFGLNIRLFPQFNPAEVSNLLTTEIDKQRGYFADFMPQKKSGRADAAGDYYRLGVCQLAGAAVIFLFTAPLVPLFMVLVGFRAADASRANLQQLDPAR